MNRIDFLREQTISGKNKIARAPLPPLSVKGEKCSLPERKALALCSIFDNMPVYIGEKELIVGTRTLFTPNPGNEDGHDIFQYGLGTRVPYVTDEEKALFGCNHSYRNRTHYTPDLSIVLHKGIGGIIESAKEKAHDPAVMPHQRDFLNSVVIAYKGLSSLIMRYSEHAAELAKDKSGKEKDELLEIAEICKKISVGKPGTFREAVQLLWFTHLGLIIESFEFINYGRLDVILNDFLGDTDKDEALEIIECLLLKMYDQVDLVTTYLGNYAAQLVVTLGGVLPNGENAVNGVTMLFLDAIDKVRFPEPEFNLRISSKNPPEFLDRASELTVSGCNFVSYYNDDIFVNNLNNAGIPIEYARSYGFDLCQDINIPGNGDFWQVPSHSLASILMNVLKSNRDYKSFEELVDDVKLVTENYVKAGVDEFLEAEKQLDLYAKGEFEQYFANIKEKGLPADRFGNSPMAPLPLLSGLFHGCIENALDVAFEPYPIKAKGMFYGTATEAINSLSAIKKIVFDEKLLTLSEVYEACENDFAGERGEYVRSLLWNAPKWGNDDDYVDPIGKDILEFCLNESRKYKTYYGGQILGGIHQPHPVSTGKSLMATPEGRHSGAPVAVTLTPESGTMNNGPTAVLASAAKIDPSLVDWNFCVMVNYFASVFKGNDGKEIFKTLLLGYFKSGGLQHQPNVLDVEELKKAQLSPEKYKDLIVRLWGVSAHFVDLPRELQDEMIARFS